MDDVHQISASGFLAHGGHNYHVGEVSAGHQVGLLTNSFGKIELHYANLHLGNLHPDPTERFRPAASIVRSDQD